MSQETNCEHDFKYLGYYVVHSRKTKKYTRVPYCVMCVAYKLLHSLEEFAVRESQMG